MKSFFLLQAIAKLNNLQGIFYFKNLFYLSFVCDGDWIFLIDRHGCPAYASPEIVSRSIPGNNKKTGYSGKASDIWSLGVMLYTM